MEATSSMEWPSRWGRCETATPGTPAGSVTGILGGWVGTRVGWWVGRQNDIWGISTRTTVEDDVSNQRKLLRHLRMISHKLNFLQTHFPKVNLRHWMLTNCQIIQVKRLMLEEPENKCTEEGVEKVVSRIERSFGQMKVKMATDIWYTVVRRLYCKTRLTDQLKWKIFQEY